MNNYFNIQIINQDLIQGFTLKSLDDYCILTIHHNYKYSEGVLEGSYLDSDAIYLDHERFDVERDRIVLNHVGVEVFSSTGKYCTTLIIYKNADYRNINE